MPNEESRPPRLEDLLRLCRSLNEKGAKYVIVGGMAMIQQGFVRATEDIDLLVDVHPDNEKRVLAAISELPDHAARELKVGDIARYVVIRVADEIVVDLMAKTCGLGYQDAESLIEWIEIEGTKIPFASVELMIKLKQGIREKDKLDLQYLKALKS